MPVSAFIKRIAFCLWLTSFFSCGGTSNGSTDGGGDGCINCSGAYEASFIVSEMKIGTIDQGFNLDGENTQCSDNSCIQDGNNGVDNRLSGILSGMESAIGSELEVDQNLQDNIQNGNMLIIFRLMDVEIDPMGSRTSNDPDVVLKGYLGVDTDDDPSDNFSGTEPMDVDSESLSNPDDINSPRIEFNHCYIDRGKFRCEPSVFHLDLDIEGSPLSLEIHEAQLQARIGSSPTRNSEGVYLGGEMDEGILGGFVPIKYLQQALEDFADQLGDISPEKIQQILANHADIDAIDEGLTDQSCDTDADCLRWQSCRDGFCYEPANQFDSISLAVTFKLKSVELTGCIYDRESESRSCDTTQ